MVDFQALIASARVTLFASGNQRGVAFDPARDMPSLAGKVILVTGGAGDLGKQAAIEFARHKPAHIYIADLPRDDGGASVISAIRDAVADEHAPISYLEVDLASFQSIKAAATKFCAAEDRLDIAVLNAGIMRVQSGTTVEGYEITFGINYLGHALLVKLLMPTLLRTAELPGADVRVVAVSSEGHNLAPKGGILFDKLKGPCDDVKYYQRYGQSKVAVIGLARELAQQHPQIKVVAIHPGRIITGMARGLQKESLLFRVTAPISPIFCVSPAIGVRNHLWAATAPDVKSGKYYEPVGVPDRETAVGKDRTLSRRLWEWTEKELESVE
ncbi:Retinol dehydrogenase 13 [Madurella mycetomatis]|uniref:Retinol dehydrogenase 13 n=1 Tax=Madurella mycetomatis TaxID=100816 RepID=A0A175VPQ7_9PEZI|nr:Retinol dehydrogenase 13 [Madurella mycetomatis]KXX74020.1 Retinol dehydrogenase 13 [Madurella mycetomatis]